MGDVKEGHDPVPRATNEESPVHGQYASSQRPVTVLVTGFGPFLNQFPINSSWSIASVLPSELPATFAHPIPVRIVVPAEPIKVAYRSVIDAVPKFLSSEDPKYDMIVHIGLATGRSYFTLEVQSKRDFYDTQKDVDNCVCSREESAKLFAGCPEVLKPTFDCDDVWRRWRTNVSDPNADIRTSKDPGNYLCGFIYYLSMSWFWKKHAEERPVVFLHVPNLPTDTQVEEGKNIAIGLIRALVASRAALGVRDPLK